MTITANELRFSSVTATCRKQQVFPPFDYLRLSIDMQCHMY